MPPRWYALTGMEIREEPHVKGVAWLIVGLFAAAGLPAADWPQYRHDATRSAASPEQLSSDLRLQWVRHFPTPRPAFPNELRLRYDASYEPVVLGKSIFVPSMVTDCVTALDTETGTVRWRFFSDGPVRFAPVAWQGRVFFVSDDGHLYCVDAARGKLLWKFRGLPEGRKERKVMGDRRLISLWPARGGPVLLDGTVYFAAGIWSAEGVAVHALDAETGRVVWSNVESSKIPRANMDHGVANSAGLTPQGYLVVTGGKLVVPCGAQLPAFLDRKTGELLDYTMGWGGRIGLPKGSWSVASVGNYLVQSGDLYDMQTPNQEKFRNLKKGQADFKSRLYTGGFTRLQIDPRNQKHLGVFRQPVLTESAVYYSENDGIVAKGLTEAQTQPRAKSQVPSHRKNDQYPDKLQVTFRELWSFPSKLDVHIKAGGRVYAGGPGVVQALDIPDRVGEPKIAWRAEIQGVPHRMLAADGKLFVVTREGLLFAFGSQKRDGEPVVHGEPSLPLSGTDSWSERTTEILETSGVREGYALVLGVGTGRLAEELLRQSKLRVIAVDPSARRVATLREKFHRAGLYGTRIVIHTGDPMSFPFPPYLASLIVSEDPASIEGWSDSSLARAVFQLLRPYGGTACLEIPASGVPVVHSVEFVPEPTDPGLPGATLRRAGGYMILTRQGPLPDTADWSQRGANAGNTGAARDRSITAPFKVLWFDGAMRWGRQPGQALVRVAGGRMLVLARSLRAIDVYTGREMWEVAVPRPQKPEADLVVAGDTILVTARSSCLVLDAASGRKTGEISAPARAGVWSSIRVWGDYLVGTCGKLVVCVSRDSHEPLWQHQCGRRELSLALGAGKVFCAELANKRKGETSTKTRALDIATGEPLWQIDSGSEIRYSEPLDLVVTSSGIYKGCDGTRLRDNGLSSLIVDEKLLSGGDDNFAVYDLLTGQRSTDELKWFRRGCTRPLRASSNIVTTRYRGNAAYIDLATRRVTSLWDVRSGCNNNLFPANGILCVPGLTGGCTCNYLSTSQAFVSVSVLEQVADQQARSALQRARKRMRL